MSTKNPTSSRQNTTLRNTVAIDSPPLKNRPNTREPSSLFTSLNPSLGKAGKTAGNREGIFMSKGEAGKLIPVHLPSGNLGTLPIPSMIFTTSNVTIS